MSMLCATSVRAEQESNLCENAFGFGTWYESESAVLKTALATVIEQSKTPYSFFLCEGSDEGHVIAVSSIPFPDEFPNVIFVGFNSDFIRAHPETLVAIFAHEIAHYSIPVGRQCVRMDDSFASQQWYDQCEALVDIQAAKWVGKDAVVSALSTCREYLNPRLNGMIWKMMRTAFARRIRAVERAGG